jgi:hypothetical protein
VVNYRYKCNGFDRLSYALSGNMTAMSFCVLQEFGSRSWFNKRDVSGVIPNPKVKMQQSTASHYINDILMSGPVR